MIYTEIPLRFKFDYAQSLKRMLRRDMFGTLLRAEQNFRNDARSQTLSEAADLAIPDSEDGFEVIKNEVFKIGSAVTWFAFGMSDAPHALRDITYAGLLNCRPPSNCIEKPAEEVIDALEELAAEGHASHPELTDHTSMLQKYCSELNEDLTTGWLATIGAGYAMYQFDTAWERTRKICIDDTVTAEIKDMDWDRLLR